MKNVFLARSSIFLALSLFGIGQVSYGQNYYDPLPNTTPEEPVYVCENGEECKQVNPTTLVPLESTFEAELEWVAYQTPPDPMFPGTCAETKAKVLTRFEHYIQQESKIPLIGIYQWRGRTDEDAPAIIERILALPNDGHWERTRISSWSGSEKTKRRVPVSIRWTNGSETSYFSFRKADECYFLEFSGAPSLHYTSSLPAAPENIEAPPAKNTDIPASDIITF